jgi:uncharacterized membrane protein
VRWAEEVVAVAEVRAVVEVAVPQTTAFEQWSRFEEYSHFMDGVESVVRREDGLLHWRTKFVGNSHEFDVIVDEWVPPERVAWRSVRGGLYRGHVKLRAISPLRTRVELRLEVEPQSVLEWLAHGVGLVNWIAQRDVQRFADHVERTAAAAARGSQDAPSEA